ncbi:MAG: hypothetical protein CMQ40_01190 [Gammaproteobacteria bacterium]|nr:hypothetical protein [Gammaproteobacteria bacterium]
MYTFAPIPSWKELLCGLLAWIKKTELSASPWSHSEKHMVWLSNGTAIIDYIVTLQSEKIKNRQLVIWLPDYFCNNALQLVKKQDALIKFYPINSMFDPDWKACEEMVKAGCIPDVFILVHYFGRAANVSCAAEFCRKTQAFLLEDAAHVLSPHGEIGKYSNAIFYCPHKVLASPDGAILCSSTIALSPILKNLPFPKTWLFKKVLQRILPTFFLRCRNQNLPGFFTDGRSIEKTPETSVSSLGRCMISLTLSHLDIIGNARKQAATKWRDAFLPYNELCSAALSIEEEGPSPYRFVLRFKDAETAANVFTALRLDGIAVESWPDLPPDLHENLSTHRVAYELRRTLIFFPIFQALPSDLIRVVKLCMKNALGKDGPVH